MLDSMAANLDNPLPGLNPLSGVPKRKPVLVPADATTANTGHGNTLSLRGWLAWSQLPKKKQILIVTIAFAVICPIALAIGLAVGLTVGKKHSNFPLPTSHGGPYQGDLTYYEPALGSCGIASPSSDMICAISHILFDAASSGSYANANPLCGLRLRLRRNGSSVDVTVVDRCVGCKETDLDVSPAAFNQIARPGLGRVSVQWAWLEDTPL